MRLVILQPFYLPYCGVFEQVRLADTFVFYDDVQFVKQNWQHRNQVKTANGPVWLSVPVQRNQGQRIDEARIADDRDWAERHRRTLEQAYAKAPHGRWLLDALGPLYEKPWEKLVDLNIETFTVLCGLLGVDAELRRSSEWALPGSGHERVLAYCRELGATSYLSGPAARSYLDEPSFAEAGVQLEYLAFDHPTYPQIHGEFVPYLSVVDLLANVGPEAGALLAGCGRAVPVEEWSDPGA